MTPEQEAAFAPWLDQVHCIDAVELMRALPAGSIDMVFVDPPYGHNNNNGDMIARWEAIYGGGPVPESDWRPIANDGPEANDLFRACLPEFARILKPGCCCCCCCSGGGPDPQFARWSIWIHEQRGLDFKMMIVWDKGPMGMGHHYRRSYETVLISQVPGAACRWFDETNSVENIIRPGNGIRKIIPQAAEHPTEKPVALAAHFIRLHTRPGDVVLDCFSGSGSTLEACIREGRHFVGADCDPQWVEIARRRIAEAQAQPRLDFAPQPKPSQGVLL